MQPDVGHFHPDSGKPVTNDDPPNNGRVKYQAHGKVEVCNCHGAAAFAAEWLRHRGCAWAVELLPEPPSDRQHQLPLTTDMEIDL